MFKTCENCEENPESSYQPHLVTFLIFSPNTRIKTGVGIIGTTEGQKGNLFIATGKLKINAIMGLKWIFFLSSL